MVDTEPDRAAGDPDSPRPGAARRASGKQRAFWKELSILVVVGLLVAVALTSFVGRRYVIPTESMEGTLLIGDSIYVQKLSYYFGDPGPGDVVVFVGPPSWNDRYPSIRSDNAMLRGVQNSLAFVGLGAPDENDLVKRVIAVGGQTVQCCDAQGRVLVDGKPIDEPYVAYSAPYVPGAQYPVGREFPKITVPDGNLWVMGDNRDRSADSRAHMADKLFGTVPTENVRGKTTFKIWPPGRMGFVSSQPPDPAE